MSGPIEGEPFFAYPGLRVSAGDPGAAPGTDAYKAVVVLDPNGMPSPHIIDAGDPFQLKVQIRTALAGVGYELPGPFFANFHLHELDGDAAAGSPFAGTDPPVAEAAPGGDSGPAGPFDEVRWYSSTTGNIHLPSGTYRITVHGHMPGTGLMFVHDGAIVHVGT